MTRSVQLCEGSISNLDEVMAVMEDSFDPAFGEAWTAPQCAGLIPLPGVWLSLARAGGEAIGFALGRLIVDEAELLLLAVKKRERGHGVGGQLLHRFSLIASARGAENLHLEVREGNPAVNLYKQAGFLEIGRRRNYYSGRDGQTYDALTLAKSASV